MKSDEAGHLTHYTETPETCAHSRLVDYVQTNDGRRTGQLRCRECGTVFPDSQTDTT